MRLPLAGLTVVEVASWTFVPAATAILSDLGAEVIKVEPPAGDPQRQLVNRLNIIGVGPNPYLELPNRGKRSVVLDLSDRAGRAILGELISRADVFATNYLPSSREKHGLDEEFVRRFRDDIVYAVGSGWGSRGPWRETGGFDLAAGWASSGLAHLLTPKGGEPPHQPPAFFDLQAATALSSAIFLALFDRERTGRGESVEVSLLNVAMWAMSPDIMAAPYAEQKVLSRREQVNPLSNWYPTKDDRWLYLVLLQSDRYWAELCAYIDATELLLEERFVDDAARRRHRGECVDALTEVFLSRTLQEWKETLDGFSGVWAPVQSALEVHDHPQIAENGFLPRITPPGGEEFAVVAVPMQFAGQAPVPQGSAPALGADTGSVLAELGYDGDTIEDLRSAGVVA